MTTPNSSVCPNCGLALHGTESVCPRCGYELAITPLAPPPPPQGAPPPSVQIARGQCPHCGLQLPHFQPNCPNCGANVIPVQEGSWPPPTGYVAPLPPTFKLVTGHATVDVMLGFFVCLGSLLVYGIGFIAMPIVYFSLRQTYRYFARGVGYALATVGVILLGVFVWCVASLSGTH